MPDKHHIFLCWSGTRSGRVAEALKKAIDALPGFEAFRSPDITKGSLWFPEVMAGLGSATAAVVCLTPENRANPWMHFEAGALAARMAAAARGAAPAPRVYPYLFRMEGVELAGPLSQYQGTRASQEDTLKMVREWMGESTWARWSAHKERWWRQLQEGLLNAHDRPKDEVLTELPGWFRRKTFDEPLDECVNQGWVARWHGARETQQLVNARLREAAQQCRPHVSDLLVRLNEAVDAYAMALELLLQPADYPMRDDGRRDVPAGVLAACEERRHQVKDLVAACADPRLAPVLDDAVRFAALETFAQKKSFVHRFEAELAGRAKRLGARRAAARAGKLAAPAGRGAGATNEPKALSVPQWRLEVALQDPALETSDFDFDRIAFYLNAEQGAPALEAAAAWLRRELERARARPDTVSHMPLTYCLGPLGKAIDATGRAPAGRLLEDLRRDLNEAVQRGRDREAKAKAKKQAKARVQTEAHGGSTSTPTTPDRLRMEAEALLASIAARGWAQRARGRTGKGSVPEPPGAAARGTAAPRRLR